jgi:hypothetical protein
VLEACVGAGFQPVVGSVVSVAMEKSPLVAS